MNRAWSVPLLLVLAAVLLVYGPSMLPDRVLSPFSTSQWLPWAAQAGPDVLGSDNADTLRENLAYRAYLTDALRDGVVPLWNPHVGAGSPFLALGHTQALYPVAWLLALVSPTTAMGATVAVHTLIAAAGMLALLRVLGCRPQTAALGVVAFAFNEMFLSRHGHPQFIATAAWLPWMWWAIESLPRRGATALAALAGSTALCVLAGHPAVYVYGLMGLVVVTLLRHRRQALQVALGLGLGLMLSAPQWAPMLELATESARADRSAEVLVQRMLEPAQLLRLVDADALGKPFDRSWTSASPFPAGALYVSVVALWAAFAAGRRHAGLAVAALTVLAVVFVEPLYRLLLWLPGMGFSRIDRALVAWFLLVSVLAALGAERIMEQGRAKWLLAPLAALAVAMGLAGNWSGLGLAVALGIWVVVPRLPGGAWWLAGLALVDLVPLASQRAIVRDASMLEAPSDVTWLQGQGSVRLARLGGLVQGQWRLMPANLGVLYGLDDIGSFGPLRPQAVGALLETADPGITSNPWHLRPLRDGQALASPAVAALGVTHALALGPVEVPGWSVVRTGALTVLEAERPLPLAYGVSEILVEPDREAAAALIASGQVDLFRQAVVSDAVAAGSAPVVEVEERGPNHLRLRTRGAGVVVVLDQDYPGWSATVDGQHAPLVTANSAFRAVSVPEGEHLVEMRFRPKRWSLAWGLAVLALLVLGLRLNRSRAIP